eukprot:6460811-Amphidinium_carterae.1
MAGDATIPCTNTHMRHTMAMRAVRAYKEEGERKCRDLLRKSCGWDLDAESELPGLLRALVRIYTRAHEEVLVEELWQGDDEEKGMRHQRSRREFVQRQLQRWKSAAMTKSQPIVHLEGRYGAEVDRPELELECLRQHWQGIYCESAMPSDAPLDDLLAFAPSVLWPTVTVTADDIHECLRRLPDTGAGPDGLTHNMISGLESVMVPLIQATYDGVVRGEGLSSSWRRCSTALIPKVTGPIVHADAFRLLALANIGPKLVSRLAAYKLRALDPWEHVHQFGFRE